MKRIQISILVSAGLMLAGCASMPPKELVNARAAYRDASEGPATQLVPAELHKAKDALNLAEKSFLKEPNSYRTKDLAYVAERKSELAGALGVMAANKSSKETANADFQKKQTELLKQGKQDLLDSEQQSQQDLNASEQQAQQALSASQQKAQQDLDASKLQAKQELSDSEKRTKDAMAELAKLAAVKEEERGLVVTLSGSVLFRSGDSTLLSSAQVKLDQVAKALLAVHARNLVVEGFTDSQGTESYNQGLSQRRADAVRIYLVQKGYPTDRIQARGRGEGSPIANNASAEGRANNRRVEIIIERESMTSKP